MCTLYKFFKPPLPKLFLLKDTKKLLFQYSLISVELNFHHAIGFHFLVFVKSNKMFFVLIIFIQGEVYFLSRPNLKKTLIFT